MFLTFFDVVVVFQILYTGDFSRQEDRHLMAAEIPSISPDVLIIVSYQPFKLISLLILLCIWSIQQCIFRWFWLQTLNF